MSKRILHCFIIPLFSLLILVSCYHNAVPTFAATQTYYDNYGYTNGAVPKQTRVKYTYNSSNNTSSTATGSATKIGTIENKTSKTKTCTGSFSLTYTTTLSISATLPINVYQSISNVILDLGTELSKSTTSTSTLSISETLPANSSVKVYVRYDTETIKRTVTCQKQVQSLKGVWSNSGSSYTRTITTKNKYPVLYTN